MKTYIRQEIQAMNEADLRRLILIPLLEKMGHRDVEEYHGASELGMDIVSWNEDERGCRQNWAVVAKSMKVSGRASAGAGTLAEIQTQIFQCIGGTYPDPRTTEPRTVDRVLVVSNQVSRRQFVAGLAPILKTGGIEGKVEFWNLDALWDRYKKHVIGIEGSITELLQRSGEVDTHYRLEYGEISERQTEIYVVPKYPGAEKDKPIRFHMEFGNEPEGEAVARAIKEMFAKGTSVEIPGKYLSWENLPGPLQDKFDELRARSVTVSSLPDPNLPDLLVRVNFVSNEGDRVSVDSIRLKVTHQGTEQVTLSNEGQTQSIPFGLELVLSEGHGQLTLHFRIPYPISVFQLQQLLKLQSCISKPFTIGLSDVATGMQRLGTIQSDAVLTPPDPEYMELVDSLVVVQNKIRRPIEIPNREWTDEERKAAGILNMVVQHGGYLMEWSEWVLGWRPGIASRVQLLNIVEKSRTDGLWLRTAREADTINLFGVEIPLGRVQASLHARIANRSDLLKWIYLPSQQDTTLSLRLVPGKGDAVYVQFPDWMPLEPLELPEWFQ